MKMRQRLTDGSTMGDSDAYASIGLPNAMYIKYESLLPLLVVNQIHGSYTAKENRV